MQVAATGGLEFGQRKESIERRQDCIVLDVARKESVLSVERERTPPLQPFDARRATLTLV